MKQLDNVNINTIARVKSFVDINSQSPCEVDVLRGRYIIDGKSIMGLFSLDLSKDVIVILRGEDGDINNLIEQYKEKGYID